MAKSTERKVPISKVKELAKKEAEETIKLNKNLTISTITYACILSMADLYKNNQKKKIQEFIAKLKINLVAIRDKDISPCDIEEVLKNEYGLDIEKIFSLE